MVSDPQLNRKSCNVTILQTLQVMEPGDAVSYTAGSREAALHALAGRCAHIVPLLDAFEHRTAAGRHACMVLERQGSPLDYVSLTSLCPMFDHV
jgi:hypothetical protein